jgi:hypothetical protein
MVEPMKGYGIYELYRQMAGELAARETVRIEAPDPMHQRHLAILEERERFAGLMRDRPAARLSGPPPASTSPSRSSTPAARAKRRFMAFAAV